MKGHGYVLLPSRLVGAVLGDSDVLTSAACVDRPQRHPPLRKEGCILPCEWVAPLDGQASWVNPCVRTF